MESLLGFELDLWDYLTFLTLMLCVVALILTWLFLAGLPGRIALARKHPEAEAVKYLGYAGLLPTVYPWMQALIWAFKPISLYTTSGPRCKLPIFLKRWRDGLGCGGAEGS